MQAGLNILRDLVKNEPANPMFQFILGRALLLTGDLDGARAQFQQSVKTSPRYLAAILALGEVSKLKRDYNQVLFYANQALAINPTLGEARLQRTAALLGTQNLAEARNELTAMAESAPQNSGVQFQIAALDMAEKKFVQAEALLQQLYQKDRIRALNGLVESYKGQGQFDKAISRLNLELEKAPNTAAIRFLLAETLMGASKYDLARQQYEQLRSQMPRSSQVRMRLGALYQLKRDLSKAIESFQEARELSPNDPLVVLGLADALQVAGRNAEAIENYRRVLILDPENARAMNNLAYTLLDAGGAPDEAQKLVEQALRKSPKNSNYADTLGMVYLKKNLDDSALQVFGGLAQRFPDNPVYHYHYALSLNQKGQKAKAKTELNAALSESPTDDLRKSIQTSLAKIKQ